MDLPFNLLVLAVDAFVVVSIARSRRASEAVLALAAGVLATFVATVLFQRGLFHLIRLYAWVVFAHVPLVLFGLAWILRKKSRRSAAACVAAALLIGVVAYDAFLIEPRRLELTHVEVYSEKVSRPLRIAIVADFQTDRISGFERRALELALATEPDLILMPGDYLHDNSTARHGLAAEFRALLTELRFGAPMGAFATRGNTEHNDWPEMFEGTGVTTLTGTTRLDLDEVVLTGLGLRDSFNPGMRVDGTSRFHIAFGHAPDFALGDVAADLLVAGHTHGGQVRLPLIGPLMTMSRVPRSWAAGTTELSGGRTLVVSRGIGMERGPAPRLRFLCRPEIVLVEILPTVGV